MLWTAAALASPVPGFLESWSGTDLHGWGGGGIESNPGSGGYAGAQDGYLLFARTESGRMGVNSTAEPYLGDWIAANVVQVRFALNDVGADEPLEIHFSIGYHDNLWQYDEGFAPPLHQWAEFIVDLTDSTKFTQIISHDGRGFAAALQDVRVVHVRHDLAPFAQSPDPIQADVGLDHLQLLDPEHTPVTRITWGRLKRGYQ